jgi:hypothetical protein
MPDPVPPPEPKPPMLSDYLTVLKMHVDIANGEKQAIWTRQATMLVGNTIIFAASRSDQIDQKMTLNIVGLLLCILWAAMTLVGWCWFHKSLRDGAAVPIDPIPNPFADPRLSNPSFFRDPIFLAAMAVVGLFAALYLIGLWPEIKRICLH